MKGMTMSRERFKTKTVRIGIFGHWKLNRLIRDGWEVASQRTYGMSGAQVVTLRKPR